MLRRACLAALAAAALCAEIAELSADNFDTVLKENADVLVHFYAPCAARPARPQRESAPRPHA